MFEHDRARIPRWRLVGAVSGMESEITSQPSYDCVLDIAMAVTVGFYHLSPLPPYPSPSPPLLPPLATRLAASRTLLSIPLFVYIVAILTCLHPAILRTHNTTYILVHTLSFGYLKSHK